MEYINNILSGIIMPIILMGFGAYFGAKLRFFYVAHPLKVARELARGSARGGISPARALTQALAGTLGVGNMTGVATAICSGGAGAVFWMWISAFLAMSIKYFEVALAQRCRRRGLDGYYGGAMYYIKDVFSHRFPRLSVYLGGFFAVLCIVNSLLTGNIVQINSAADALSSVPSAYVGILCAAAVFPVILGKGKRVSSVTMGLIPILSAVYIVASLAVIIPCADRLPAVFSEIVKSAFSLKAAGGGAFGYLVVRAIRFGTTRGIFSNEAGSGTSPTAHAEADSRSPHAQGCFGIFEVFADTIVLCTMTSLVILLSDGTAKGLTGISLTLYAFSSGAGRLAGVAIALSVIMFAYATVICQARYGIVALRYLTESRAAFYLYVFAVCGCCVLGAVINEGVMWQAADFVVSLMTAVNVLCLAYSERKGILKEIVKDYS